MLSWNICMRSRRARHPALLSLLAVLLSGCFSHAPVSNQPVIVGTVTKAIGTPSIIRRNESYLIGVESLIYAGDIIQTDNGSKAQLTMIDRSVIRVGNNAHVVIHRYEYTPGESSPQALITFTSGAIQIDTAGFAQAKHPDFQIQTPLASISLHSTKFWAGFIPGDRLLNLLLLHGKNVHVANDQGSVNLNSAGLGTTVTAGRMPQAPVKWNTDKRETAIGTTTM